jgi:hypothetical protein
MSLRLDILPEGLIARFADCLMVPLMYLLSGTFSETPQRTHRWNTKKWRFSFPLEREKMVSFKGRRDSDCWIPLFHMPILGGWRHYVVLEPEADVEWHVGWYFPDRFGVSRIPISGRVRMLIGPADVSFFAVCAGWQIPIRCVGEGDIGDRCRFSKTLLL